MENIHVLRIEWRARRMHDVMDRLNVDRGVLARVRGGAAYLEARKRCLFCGTSHECLRWLDQRPARQPAFCPNLAIFAGCRPTTTVEREAR